MNIKKHVVFFSILLGLVVAANAIGIIIGIVKGFFDGLFIISAVTMLCCILVVIHFYSQRVKYNYVKADIAPVNEKKNISLLVLGISFILFILAIILSSI